MIVCRDKAAKYTFLLTIFFPAPAPAKPYKSKDWSKEVGQSRDALKGTIPVLQASLQRSKELSELSVKQDIDPAFIRKFESDATYDPFDFSMIKFKIDRAAHFDGPKTDLFKATGQDPLDFWKHPDALSDYVTTNGRIIKGVLLGHSGKTQRRLAKAIRRSRAAGLMPYFHKSVNNIAK